jgi:hypothetical protein
MAGIANNESMIEILISLMGLFITAPFFYFLKF